MKYFLILIAMAATLGTTQVQPQQSTPGQAQAQQIQGLYIFFASKPTTQAEYLGSVKVRMCGSSSMERINCVIKKTKKDYPQAEGIVFQTLDMASADAIKF